MKQIQKLPDNFYSRAVPEKINACIDAIHELQEAVKPAEGECKYCHIKRGELDDFVTAKEAKARLEGKIEGLEKAIKIINIPEPREFPSEVRMYILSQIQEEMRFLKNQKNETRS
jgi:hypothetical protein